jgi:NitT/TauT family transport system permease protein
VSTFGAIDNVPRNLVRMAQSFGVPFFDVVRKVLLPGALPGILSGFRISASIALLLVVAAEMIGADRGIGAFVMQAGNLMQTDQLLAGVAVLSMLGLLIGIGLSRLERALLSWR